MNQVVRLTFRNTYLDNNGNLAVYERSVHLEFEQELIEPIDPLELGFTRSKVANIQMEGQYPKEESDESISSTYV